MSDDSMLVIDYDDIKRAMKQEAQESSRSTFSNQSYSEQNNTNQFNPNVRIDQFASGQRARRASKLFRTKQDAYTIVAAAVACVVFVSVIVGAFYFLFSVWSDSDVSIGIITGKDLFLYNEKKDSEPLAEVLCEVAKDSIVQIEAYGVGISQDELKFDVGGMGTGCVVSSDSQGRLLILTNFHVISTYYCAKYFEEEIRKEHSEFDVSKRGSYLKVSTSYGDGVRGEQCELLAVHKSETIDRQGIEETIKGQYKGTDLALIRTPPLANMRPKFYISHRNNLKNGEHLITIGHPKGRVFSPSEGTNQGLRDGRTDPGLRQYDIRGDVITCTVPINPGNSGGPVFDSKGRIIGVSTSKALDQDLLSMGYPADEVLNVDNWKILIPDPSVSELFNNIPRQ